MDVIDEGKANRHVAVTSECYWASGSRSGPVLAALFVVLTIGDIFLPSNIKHLYSFHLKSAHNIILSGCHTKKNVVPY